MSEAERIAALDGVLRAWTAAGGVTLACGRWGDGALLELVLDEGAEVTPPSYGGRFTGLREVRPRGQRHHLHVDLGRVSAVTYGVRPSVCFGYRPSFEVHFAGPAREPSFSVMLESPYRGRELDPAPVGRFFDLLRAHAAAHPRLVRFAASGAGGAPAHDEVWRAVGAAFGVAAAAGPAALARAVREALAIEVDGAEPEAPEALGVLDRALRLPRASLVVYRARTLVEFKTDRLGRGVSAYEEAGHRSWQIGAFEDHHCHLDLDAVTEAHFDAEPVSCQGGRTNWTVWFLAERDAGNPYRPRAVCSVTLNAPYLPGGARDEAVADVYALHDRVRHLACVTASEAFLAARAPA